MPVLSLMLLLVTYGEGALAQGRQFSWADMQRVREPRLVTLSADGRWIAFAVGDSLWISSARAVAQRLDPGRTLVSVGMARQLSVRRPFVAWPADGTRLAFRTGSGGVYGQGTPMIADVRSGVRVTALLPDSLLGRLNTFRHSAAGGPSWDPDGSRIAFLAEDTTHDADLEVYVKDMRTGVIER